MPAVLTPLNLPEDLDPVNWNAPNALEVDKADLHMLPDGAQVYFFGVHPASKYMVKVIGERNDRRIIIMHGTDNRRVATGPLEAIVSIYYGNFKNPTIEEGILIKGWFYRLPYFQTEEDGSSRLNYKEERIENYTKILLCLPS